MIVKNVEEKDLPALFRLYTDLIDREGNYENMCRVFKEAQVDDKYTLFGVYDGDELVGTATVSKCLDLTGDARYYYSMENFIIDKSRRREGLGKLLLTEVEEFVKKNNGSYISFTSSVKRRSAHEFYKSMGYEGNYVKGFKKVFPN